MPTIETQGPQPESVATKMEKLIMKSHFPEIYENDIETIEQMKEAIAQRMNGCASLLNNKKSQLQEALDNQKPHKEVEILVAELIQKEQVFRELEMQFALVLSILKQKKFN